MTPKVLRDPATLNRAVAGWKAEGHVIGLVPTMGALHEGHLSLVRRARRDCARVIVSIFVNPAQFGSAQDLARYPRTEAADLALLDGLGVDGVWAPDAATVYPPGFATTVRVAGASDVMEGAHRPGHFDAVATVVVKLLGATRADRAYFGEKDWQQLHVVRRVTADLDLGVQIIGCETVREADGLAMSSRNVRLDARARAAAPALFAALDAAARNIRGGDPVEAALAQARTAILDAGFEGVDYLDLRDAQTLEPATDGKGPARLLVAAHLGGVRLIDTVAL